MVVGNPNVARSCDTAPFRPPVGDAERVWCETGRVHACAVYRGASGHGRANQAPNSLQGGRPKDAVGCKVAGPLHQGCCWLLVVLLSALCRQRTGPRCAGRGWRAVLCSAHTNTRPGTNTRPPAVCVRPMPMPMSQHTAASTRPPPTQQRIRSAHRQQPPTRSAHRQQPPTRLVPPQTPAMQSLLPSPSRRRPCHAPCPTTASGSSRRPRQVQSFFKDTSSSCLWPRLCLCRATPLLLALSVLRYSLLLCLFWRHSFAWVLSRTRYAYHSFACRGTVALLCMPGYSRTPLHVGVQSRSFACRGSRLGSTPITPSLHAGLADSVLHPSRVRFPEGSTGRHRRRTNPGCMWRACAHARVRVRVRACPLTTSRHAHCANPTSRHAHCANPTARVSNHAINHKLINNNTGAYIAGSMRHATA